MTTTNDKLTIGQRLSAAWNLLVGRLPRQTSVENPFFFGYGLGVGAKNKSGTPNGNIPVAKLRRFSESPIPRRFINYLRGSISRLQYDIEALEGEELKPKHRKAIKRLKRLLRNPNPDDTWDSFLGQIIDDMLTTGWGTFEIKSFAGGGDDYPYMLWPVDGASIQVDREWGGQAKKPRWWQINWFMTDKPQEIPFRNSELGVLKYIPRTNTPFGLSPIESAMNEIEYLLNALAFAGRTASNAQPKKLLWVKGASKEQVNDIREWWRAEVDGSGSVPIMGGPEGAETLELGLITDQNLFLKWQEFLIAIIADAFGVDVTKANLIVGLNRSTADNIDDVTDEGAIAPLANTIEQYIDKYLLPLFGLDDVARFKFKFTTSVSDMKALSVVNQVELQADSITVNEARARTGRGPLVHSVTGEDIGNMTLSAYRAAWKTPGFSARGLKALEDHAKTLDRQANLQEQKLRGRTSQSEGDFEFGENSNNTSDDPSQRGGNGVYGAPKPDFDI